MSALTSPFADCVLLNDVTPATFLLSRIESARLTVPSSVTSPQIVAKDGSTLPVVVVVVVVVCPIPFVVVVVVVVVVVLVVVVVVAFVVVVVAVVVVAVVVVVEDEPPLIT